MTDHCFKLHHLTMPEMRHLKKYMDTYIRMGVKATFLKNVAYIHLDESQRYSGVFNGFHYFISMGKFHASERNMEWLRKWDFFMGRVVKWDEGARALCKIGV